MSAQQKLIKIEEISEANAPAIYVAGGLQQFIDLVKGEVLGEVPDLKTRKGRERIASLPMPTENRSSNTEMVSDSEMTECQFHNNCGGWCETRRELEHNLCEHCLESHDEEMAEPAPAPQPHSEPASYPPCDYCGAVPSYHPWHGSGVLNGVENRHIHACDGCRGQLPSHPGQPHPEPIAWMVGTAIWWTKEEAERDAAEVGLPVVGVGPMTGLSVPAVSIPDGYCLMPRRLTAENGAKALLLGEFKLEVTRECPECLELDEPAEGCEICDGEGEYAQRHMIPWDKIKYIYSEAVKGLALELNVTRKPS